MTELRTGTWLGDPGRPVTDPAERHIDSLISQLDEAVEVADELVARGSVNWCEEPVHRYAGRGAVAVIGEVAKQLPKEVRQGTRDIPWRDWAGMRDVVVHLSREIDDDMLWKTLEQDVPQVHRAVHRWRALQWELGRFGGPSPQHHLQGLGLER